MIIFTGHGTHIWASQVVLVVKNPPANAGDTRDAGLILGLGRSPGIGNGNPFQYFCPSYIKYCYAPLVAQRIKCLPALQKT